MGVAREMLTEVLDNGDSDDRGCTVNGYIEARKHYPKYILVALISRHVSVTYHLIF